MSPGVEILSVPVTARSSTGHLLSKEVRGTLASIIFSDQSILSFETYYRRQEPLSSSRAIVVVDNFIVIVLAMYPFHKLTIPWILAPNRSKPKLTL